jgi:protein involved in temperature-dependent protein secretion
MLRCHLTTWTEVGESGIFSSGQKTWMTDGIDWPLLDVREVRT